MDPRQLAGSSAEAMCADYLRKKGYNIVSMNYACRGGEIDIIAEQRPARRFLRPAAGEGYIVFVEVKMRSRTDYGTPREAVTRRKRERIRLTALTWLASHETDLQPRFDVIEVYKSAAGAEFNHIENAFE